MPLSAGTKLGPYEILAPIGAGGMGEVYRAHDTRLGRDVAVKVLPTEFSADADRMRRFELEARATGMLNHPNILAVYDVGTHDGSPYLVTELLEGSTLREQLPLPRRKGLDYAGQIAAGLAAAHAKGITHRDLKPENLFITNDGRAKILDFGLAKVAGAGSASGFASGEAEATRGMSTTPGLALGTVGYMSPEQVLGKPADPRSDIFSFGAILYEMFGGQRAFQRPSSIETLNAILKEDPPPLADPGFERIVHRCLEKSPEQRFQSASDLAFAIANQSDTKSGSGALVAAAPARGEREQLRKWLLPAAALLLVLGLVAGYLIASGGTTQSAANFHKLTYRRGTIYAARFTSDGQNIVYDAAWDGNPPELFTSHRDSPESRPLGLPRTSLLSLSAGGEMAVLTQSYNQVQMGFTGTLARAPISGGAPREISEAVSYADWAPDGSGLLVVRQVGGKERLEYPAGKVLVETDGWISHPRFSPRGDRIAYLDHPVPSDDLGSVAMVDLAGKKTTLSTGWEAEEGLAWSPDGKEIWFTAVHEGGQLSIHAVTLAGKERLVLPAPGGLMLYDLSRGGDLLLGRYDQPNGVLGMAPGETKERDLSWLESSTAGDLSRDGKTVLMTQYHLGPGYAMGLRKTDGSPVVRLGDGNALALSPDGKWAITISAAAPQELSVVPTGVGESRKLKAEGISNYLRAASWFPDSRHIAFVGAAAGHKLRTYSLDVAGGGPPRPLTPEGITGTLLSPDGRLLAASGTDGKYALYPVEGGEPAPVLGLKDGDVPIQWTADGRTLYIEEKGAWPRRIFRVDLATGRRELWKEVTPSDRAGLSDRRPRLRITPDGKAYAYGVAYTLSQLYLVRGLK